MKRKFSKTGIFAKPKDPIVKMEITYLSGNVTFITFEDEMKISTQKLPDNPSGIVFEHLTKQQLYLLKKVALQKLSGGTSEIVSEKSSLAIKESKKFIKEIDSVFIPIEEEITTKDIVSEHNLDNLTKNLGKITKRPYTKNPNKKYGRKWPEKSEIIKPKSMDALYIVEEKSDSLNRSSIPLKEKKIRGKYKKNLTKTINTENSDLIARGNTTPPDNCEIKSISEKDYYLIPDIKDGKILVCNFCDFWKNGCNFPIEEMNGDKLGRKECQEKHIHYVKVVKDVEVSKSERLKISKVTLDFGKPSNDAMKKQACQKFIENSKVIKFLIESYYNPLRYTKIDIFANNGFYDMMIESMMKIKKELQNNTDFLKVLSSIENPAKASTIQIKQGWVEFCEICPQ